VSERRVLDRGALVAGAGVGLLLILALSGLRAVVDNAVDDFDDSGWVAVFAGAQLVAYVVAGAVAGRRAPDAPLTNGGLATVLAVLAWLPVRILIWLVRDESRGLWSGDDPVFEAGPVLVAFILAFALGLVGGALGARRARAGRA
jgi:hypothetical protein